MVCSWHNMSLITEKKDWQHADVEKCESAVADSFSAAACYISTLGFAWVVFCFLRCEMWITNALRDWMIGEQALCNWILKDWRDRASGEKCEKLGSGYPTTFTIKCVFGGLWWSYRQILVLGRCNKLLVKKCVAKPFISF